MTTRRLSLIALAAAFAVSSSAAMLQSARPALADADDHHPRQHQRADRDDRHMARQDRDDRNYRRTNNNGNGYWSNGQWYSNNQNRTWNNNPNRSWSYNRNPNGTWNNGNHYGQKKHHDRDHDHDRR